MRFEKRKLWDLPCCYSVARLESQGRTSYLLAPDAFGPCIRVDALSLEAEKVWDGPGGTMAMIPLPDGSGDFLAVQGFNPGFKAEGAKVVLVRRLPQGGYEVRDLFPMPFIHRFDILERGGRHYLLCCTVCSHKENEADWSSPGAIYAAPLPEDLSQPIELQTIADGLHRNHGFCRTRKEGYDAALTSSDEGVLEILPPAAPGQAWKVTRIMDRMVSDIALCDIDEDGVDELATIEPFHGNRYLVYRRGPAGWEEIYSYPGELAFCHVAWGGRLRGEPVFLGGCRAENKELFVLRWKDSRIQQELIDTGCGPSNVTVVHGLDSDVVVVANRELGEAALYSVLD